jgi:hypothetical protein
VKVAATGFGAIQKRAVLVIRDFISTEEIGTIDAAKAVGVSRVARVIDQHPMELANGLSRKDVERRNLVARFYVGREGRLRCGLGSVVFRVVGTLGVCGRCRVVHHDVLGSVTFGGCRGVARRSVTHGFN